MYSDDNKWVGYKEGAKFENACYRFWAAQQTTYCIDKTPSCGDYGADLVVTTVKGNTAVIQCKHSIFHGKHVDLRPIQEIVAAKVMYDAQYAVVMSNMKFSNAAKILAQRNKVFIMERVTVNSDGTLSGAELTGWKDIVVNPDKRMGDIDVIKQNHELAREVLPLYLEKHSGACS